METKPVYIAWTNTDTTEGRGQSIPVCVCDSESTAIRLGAKKGVMGSNAYVTKEIAIYHERKWYVPGRITHPSKEDVIEDKYEAAKNTAIEKARLAGLTEDDIAAILKGDK